MIYTHRKYVYRVSRKERKSYVFPSRLQQHQQQPAYEQQGKKIDDFYFAFISLSLSLPHFLPLHLLCYLSNLIRNECWYVLYVLFRKGMLAFFCWCYYCCWLLAWNMFHFFMYMYVLSTSHINFYLCLVFLLHKTV